MDAEDDLIEVLTNYMWNLCRPSTNEGLLYLNEEIAKTLQCMQL